MIIGNNNNNNINNQLKPNINHKFNNQNNNINKKNNQWNNINHTPKYYNVNSTKDMHEKSFDMLQERLNNGLITLDEFNKKCNELNKLRQK